MDYTSNNRTKFIKSSTNTSQILNLNNKLLPTIELNNKNKIELDNITLNSKSTTNNLPSLNLLDLNNCADDINKNNKEKYINKLDQQILNQLKNKNNKLELEKDEIERNYNALLHKTLEDKNSKELNNKETTKLNKRIESLEKEKEGLKIEIENLEHKIKNLKLEIEYITNKFNKLISAKDENIITKTNEIFNNNQTYNNKINELNSIINNKEEVICNLKEKLIISENNSNNIEDILKEQKNELDVKLNNQIKVLKLEKEKLIIEIKKEKDRYENFCNNSKSIQKENNEFLNKKLSKIKSEYNILESLLNSEKEKTIDLNIHINDLNKTIDTNNTLIEELKAQIKTVETAKNNIETEFINFKNYEVNYLNESLSKLTKIKIEKDEYIKYLENKKISSKKEAIKNLNVFYPNILGNKNCFTLIGTNIMNKISKNNIEIIKTNYNSNLDKLKNFINILLEDNCKQYNRINNLNHKNIIIINDTNKLIDNIYIFFKNKIESLNKINTANKTKDDNNKQIINNYIIELDELKAIIKNKNEIISELNERYTETSSKFEILQNSYVSNDKLLDIFKIIELNVETLSLSISCRYCNSNSNNKNILSCGHSICTECCAKAFNNYRSIHNFICKGCKKLEKYNKSNVLTSNINNDALNISNIDYTELCNRINYLDQLKDNLKNALKILN